MSPTTHTPIVQNIKSRKNETTLNNDGSHAQQPKKGYSPTNNIKKMT